MEKRIGTVTIFLSDNSVASRVNEVLSAHANIIVARQGLPFKDRHFAVISLIVEGEVDEINALSGTLGKINNVSTKAYIMKF